MKTIDQTKQILKVLAFAGIIIVDKRLLEHLIPKDPTNLRRFLMSVSFLILLDKSVEVIFSHIDNLFTKMSAEMEADAIGMVG